MTVDELLKIPVALIERGVVALETIAASGLRAEAENRSFAKFFSVRDRAEAPIDPVDLVDRGVREKTTPDGEGVPSSVPSVPSVSVGLPLEEVQALPWLRVRASEQPKRDVVAPTDWDVRAGLDAERGTYVYADGPPFLSPDEARRLAESLWAAADEAEGV